MIEPIRQVVPEPWKYIEGMDRNDQHKIVSHIYAYKKDIHKIEGPLCARGWNRNNGEGFSIFRGNASDAGTCKICLKRMQAHLAPVPPEPRKTRWI